MLNFSVGKFSNKIQFPNTAILLLMEIMIHCMITESRFTLKVMFMYLFNILLRGLFEVMLKGTSELIEQSDLLTVLQKACGCRCLVYKEHKQPLDLLMISDQCVAMKSHDMSLKKKFGATSSAYHSVCLLMSAIAKS